jgi:hypothetical protein
MECGKAKYKHLDSFSVKKWAFGSIISLEHGNMTEAPYVYKGSISKDVMPRETKLVNFTLLMKRFPLRRLLVKKSVCKTGLDHSLPLPPTNFAWYIEPCFPQ